tara:strand:+ start:281 stop:748 length:468 start_codon:yes stop_codon:yes gene_type:complete
MNNLRTFRTIKENNSGSDYIQKRKQKNIYCATRDLAKNGGVYYKKSTLGQNRGTYVGDINVSTNGSCCLGSVTNYQSLIDVTKGANLMNPRYKTIPDLPETNEIWKGNYYNSDSSGITIIDVSQNKIASEYGGLIGNFHYPSKLSLDCSGSLYFV